MRLLALIFLLVSSIKPSSAAESDDVVLARKLEREARELCGAGCDRFAGFGALQAKIGDLDASRKSFSAGWDAAAKLEDTAERRMVLSGTAEQQAQAGQIKEATEASQRLRSHYEQAMTLGAIAIVQAQAGQEPGALETVGLIPAEEVWLRNSTLSMVAMGLLERRDVAGAIRVLNRIASDDQAAVKIFAKNRPVEQLSPQERTVIEPAVMKASTLQFIASEQAKSGDRKLGHQTARVIRAPLQRDIALRHVAAIAADAGDLAIAEAAFKDVDRQEPKDNAHVRIVAAIAKLGRFNEARDRLESIQDQGAKANAFFELAAAQAAHGDANAARSFVKTAISLDPSAKDAHNAGIKMIIERCLAAHQLELAEAFTGGIHDPSTLSQALQAIAVANCQVKKLSGTRRFFDESRLAAEKIVESYRKCVRLRELGMV